MKTSLRSRNMNIAGRLSGEYVCVESLDEMILIIQKDKGQSVCHHPERARVGAW